MAGLRELNPEGWVKKPVRREKASQEQPVRGRQGRVSAWREQSRVGRPGRTEPCKVGPGREKLPWAFTGLGGPGWAPRLWLSEKFPVPPGLVCALCSESLWASGSQTLPIGGSFLPASLTQTEQTETTTLHVLAEQDPPAEGLPGLWLSHSCSSRPLRASVSLPVKWGP